MPPLAVNLGRTAGGTVGRAIGAATRPSLGVVEISTDPPDIDLTCLLMGLWKRVGGYGGWTVAPRPGRPGLTEWDGHDPMRLQGSLLIDRALMAHVRNVGVPAAHAQDVEPDIRRLERMATSPGAGRPPAALTVNGNLPHDLLEASQNRWVIEQLEWGDVVEYDRDGNRTRQDAAVTFLLLVEIGARKRAAASAAAEFKDRQKAMAALGHQRAQAAEAAAGGLGVYVVKDSDKSLSGIAAQLLGDRELWGEIGRLNGIRDPKNIRPGQKLKVPK
jgi:hypothetical protein